MSKLIKLLKALTILGVVLLQYGVVILNLNRFGLFQKFIELEFHEEQPKQESIKQDRNEYGYPIY